MGRPRMIIVIRHAQSEGNRNRAIHQTVPDHRVRLTPEGWQQAEEAGRRLRQMLRPDDTLQFYTSPYRRTRETTDGILKTLVSDDPSPSPFPRHTVKVWEEPRLREQDFGNFQPSSTEMERMWQERADYGHFFYRIPHGESAADAYDRISGFNESLWRSFGEDDFPSVCVLVTHGLMTRVFLMKWYHWSVEYFEDLRNVSHCEFIVMKRSDNRGKYILQNELRTWSELKRKAAEERQTQNVEVAAPEPIPKKRWGGYPDDREHDPDKDPKRVRRRSSVVRFASPPHQVIETTPPANDDTIHDDHTSSSAPTHRPDHKAALEAANTPALPAWANRGNQPPATKPQPDSAASRPEAHRADTEEDEEAFPHASSKASERSKRLQRSVDISPSDFPERLRDQLKPPSSRPLKPRPQWFQAGRDFGGSESGMASPAMREGTPTSEPPGYFPEQPPNSESVSRGQPDETGTGGRGTPNSQRDPSYSDAVNEKEWAKESGMGQGARADALGDHQEEGDGSDGEAEANVKAEEQEDRSVRGSVY